MISSRFYDRGGSSTLHICVIQYLERKLVHSLAGAFATDINDNCPCFLLVFFLALIHFLAGDFATDNLSQTELDVTVIPELQTLENQLA